MSDIKNFIRKISHIKHSNVYHIQTFDLNNNLIDTKYGVNLMTTAGFDEGYMNNKASVYFIFGTATTGTIRKSDDRLFSRIEDMRVITATTFSEADNNSEELSTHRFNIYDSTTNTLTGYRDTAKVTLDYNLLDREGRDISSWLNIGEFGEIDKSFSPDGIMPSIEDEDDHGVTYTLYIHSFIYDENFQQTTITKKPNERIIITVYRSATINCDLFDTLWNNGYYFFIDPSRVQKGEVASFHSSQGGGYTYSNRRMVYSAAVNGRCRSEDDFPMFPGTVLKNGTGSGYGEILNYAANSGFGVDTRYRVTNNSREGSSSGFVYQLYQYREGHSYVSSYISNPEVTLDKTYSVYGLTITSCVNSMSSGKNREFLFVIHKNQLDTPEELTFYNAFTDDFLHPRFRNIFSMRHLMSPDSETWNKLCFPVNDFSITSVSRYNSLTDSYEAETFTNDPSYDFRNPERGVYGTIVIDGFNNNEPFDVGVNINTDIPVLGFNDRDIYTIYMTDSYWDPSTFEQLQDNTSVPVSLQHKKYFIKIPSTTSTNPAGFHTVRQLNNHALVPSFNITDLNTDNIMPRYAYNHNLITCYASDDGWAFCNGVLIYPDSDDGTGHIYRYDLNITISNNDWTFIYYTHNRIIHCDGRYRISPQDSTNPRITVFNIDPSHPEIDPNTTATVYYDSDIATETTSDPINEYLLNYDLIHVEEKKNQMFLTRKSQVKYIDLNNTTKNVTLLPINPTNNILSIIYDTKYVVYFNGIINETYKFTIYDMTTSSVYRSFEIPLMKNSTLLHLIGYSTRVYIQLTIDSTYFLIEYDYITNTVITHEKWAFNILITSESNRNVYLNKKQPRIDYNDECFVMHTFVNNMSYSDNNSGGRTIVIFKNDLDNPYFFDDVTRTLNSGYILGKSFVAGYQFGYPRLKKFNNGKDYVLLITCSLASRWNEGEQVYTGSTPTQTYCIDLGYIHNKGLHTPKQMFDELPVPLFKMPNVCSGLGGSQADSSIPSPYYYDSNNKWFTETCFYKDKVLVFTTFSPPKFVPIEMFLAHKITGTTNSIQAYSTGKKLSSNRFDMILKQL